jgi:hypothetical protein
VLREEEGMMATHHQGIFKKFKNILYILLLLLVVVSLSGCAGWFNVRNLTADNLDEGFSSVVLARVKIVDKTNLLTDSHVQLHFLSRMNNEPRFDWIHSTKKQPGTWTKQDMGSVYEAVLVGQARPGEYELVNCHIFRGSYAVNANMEKTPLKFTLKQGEALYLGTIEVVVNTVTFGENKVFYNYSYGTSNNPQTRAADMRSFQTSYPQLYQKFGNRTNTVSWK